VIDELAAAAGRLLSRLFVDIALEVLLKGPGYAVSRVLSRSPPDPDGLSVLLVGALVWLLLGGAVWLLWTGLGNPPGR
jgi:hypothetical protein